MPKKKALQPVEFNEKDYEFMNSLSAAILTRSPSKISKVIKIWLVTIFAFIGWASFAEIDEITRGDGDVVPYGQNQIIQNLEGGIVESILVKEGETVKKDQIILKINNSKSESTAKANEMKFHELEAKAIRLRAEADGKEFETKKINYQVELQRQLFESNKLEYLARDQSFIKQIMQREQEYKEATARVQSLRKSLEFVNEEIAMTTPMVRQGVKSKVDFLKLKREANGIENDIEAAELSLPRLKFAIEEYKQKRIEAQQLFKNTAKKELNEVTAEISRLKTQQVAYSDQVERTMVKSPVDGIVQKLFINTVGGVIKPGDDLVEIVPTDERLSLDVKIKPSDIAFIRPGAEVQVKITAYDFAIHGALKGKVTKISPDTITDKKDETFYMISVTTEKNYLGTKENPLQITPGMMASVDIVTGKKTIMQYLLKPILKSKQYVFSER